MNTDVIVNAKNYDLIISLTLSTSHLLSKTCDSYTGQDKTSKFDVLLHNQDK